MGAKPDILLIGGTLASRSISLREDNADVEPTYFNWSHDRFDSSTVFYMADAIAGVHSIFPPEQEREKVALLVEPRALRPENYEFVEQNHDAFDHVLTYDRSLLNAIPNGLFYPLGGSSIAFEDWGYYPKSKDICMIVSEKDSSEGHRMRHEIVDRFHGQIDFYGDGVGKPFVRKLDILKDYRYCVVVESDPSPDYFSEKLIDAVSVGCIPLHYSQRGSYSSVYFFKHHFQNMAGLDDLFMMIHNHMLYADQNAIQNNLETAKKFRIAEDFIYEVHPELFP